MLKYEPFLFKLYCSFQYVNSRAEISARAEISPCNQPLRGVIHLHWVLRQAVFLARIFLFSPPRPQFFSPAPYYIIYVSHCARHNFPRHKTPNPLKPPATQANFGFCIFAMFSTFHDEMQYIFLE